jgi:hypothetical protein
MGEIALVPPENLKQAWGDVKDFLQKVVDEYPFCQSMEWFEKNLEKGGFQLWVNVEPEDGRVSAAMVRPFIRFLEDFILLKFLEREEKQGQISFRRSLNWLKISPEFMEQRWFSLEGGLDGKEF